MGMAQVLQKYVRGTQGPRGAVVTLYLHLLDEAQGVQTSSILALWEGNTHGLDLSFQLIGRLESNLCPNSWYVMSKSWLENFQHTTRQIAK